MTHDFYRLMRDAAELTRHGDLGAATQTIQRALQGAPAAAAALPNPASAILDGLTRVIPSTDAPTEAPPPATGDERWIDGSFTHQGRTLAYKLFVPAAASPAPAAGRPLVVMLHGCTQGAQDFATGTQMNALARKLGALVLYPEQSQRANPQKCWNWFKPQHQQRGRGEPAVLAALAQTITRDYHADPARVYVAGLSAGGAMADILGRSYPDLFAAVGVHSGLPSGAARDAMSALAAMRSGPQPGSQGDARRAPPTIVFHGDADATVQASNGAAVADAARQSPGSALTASTRTGSSPQGQRYTRTAYASGQDPATVEYWQLHGAGHAWSGGDAHGSYTDPRGIDASAEMLRFFMAHPLAA